MKRRFEFIVRTPERVFIDDYAHHPAELEAAISARMLYPDRKITGIFQPHLIPHPRFRARFRNGAGSIGRVHSAGDLPGPEEPIPGVTSAIIADRMKNTNVNMTTKAGLLNLLENKELDVLMTMGAGRGYLD